MSRSAPQCHPVLHRQAEDRRYRRPRREVQPEVRHPARQQVRRLIRQCARTERAASRLPFSFLRECPPPMADFAYPAPPAASACLRPAGPWPAMLAFYVLAGLFGRDPWKGEDAIHIGALPGTCSPVRRLAVARCWPDAPSTSRPSTTGPPRMTGGAVRLACCHCMKRYASPAASGITLALVGPLLRRARTATDRRHAAASPHPARRLRRPADPCPRRPAHADRACRLRRRHRRAGRA
jgi:hypothetical protein